MILCNIDASRIACVFILDTILLALSVYISESVCGPPLKFGILLVQKIFDKSVQIPMLDNTRFFATVC